MERRRQRLLTDTSVQPLGRNSERLKSKAAGALGADVGQTDFKSATGPALRPKIAQNPAARRKLSSPSPIESDSDPIDFLSSQESITKSSSSVRASVSTLNDSKRVPEPPPFGANKSTKAQAKPRLTPQPPPFVTTARQPKPSNGAGNSDDSSSVASKRSASGISTGATRSSESPPTEELAGSKLVRTPAPAPFTSVGRSRAPASVPTKQNQPSSSSALNIPASEPKDLRPAPPPFGKSAKPLPGAKRTASKSVDQQYDTVALPSSSDAVPVKSLPRIPRKEQISTTAAAKAATNVPKRVPAEFPMAAYAREAAARAAAEANAPSAQKRFKPEDMERFLQPIANFDDSLNFDDDTLLDPKDLCPFCDELFPDNPSPHLTRMLAELKLVAKPEPRARNPLGLTAPLMTFVNLCHMHRAESTYVQQGKDNHWPVVIDWDNVRDRLSSTAILRALRGIISNPQTSDFFIRLAEEIKRSGILKAASIKSQLNNFERSHPGYYGEQGTVVFSNVLNKQFPELSPEDCRPLAPREFILSVLVPEAAILLIERDMGCSHEEARVILRESRQYGQMMFPDSDGTSTSDGHMGEIDVQQLQWRKDMIQTNSDGRNSAETDPTEKTVKVEPLRTGRLFDDDVLIID